MQIQKDPPPPRPAKPVFKLHGYYRDDDFDGRRRTGATAKPACRKAGATIDRAKRHKDFEGEPLSGDIRSEKYLFPAKSTFIHRKTGQLRL